MSPVLQPQTCYHVISETLTRRVIVVALAIFPSLGGDFT